MEGGRSGGEMRAMSPSSTLACCCRYSCHSWAALTIPRFPVIRSPSSPPSFSSLVRPSFPSPSWSEPDAAVSCNVGRWAGVERQPLLRMERSWSNGTANKNKALVQQLHHYGIIKSKKVIEVMETIDRGTFVPPGSSPYFDNPMPIGYNATISAPHMHAMCLELLEEHLQPGMRALDVGSGTGYLTACFALMVGPEGHAVGVEHIPELAASSIKNIKRSAAAELLKDGSLSVHVADGRLGWLELAPYDTIHVGAAAPEIPQSLIDQLKPGGRMVLPVGTDSQDLKVVDKKADGSVDIISKTSVRYVPLTSRAKQLQK